MDRRSFLVLSASALGLAGCTSDVDQPTPTASAPEPAPAEDPDAALRARVAASELGLIAAYRGAITQFPRRAEDLSALLAQHEAHLARMAPDMAPPVEPSSGSPSGSPSASSSGSSSGSPSASASASQGDAAPITLRALSRAESAAQAQHVVSCDAAQDPALARDLCLMAASEAQHVAVLDSLRDGRSTS